MPGRLPTPEDLPSNAIFSIIPSPPSHPATNVLLLLHGLGDTNAPFASFASKLNLPETACISLRGLAKLPFDLEGYHWGDDIIFDEGSGEMDVDTGFKRATKLVSEEVIRKGLVGKCGYKTREIILFGFGQGGMVALNVAAEMGREDELGGVVSIGGALPSIAPLPEVGKSRTPIVACKGNRKSAVKEADVEKLKDTFEFVEIKEWKKTGDGMPTSREEMLPIMQFFARRLRSGRGVPSGSVEIT